MKEDEIVYFSSDDYIVAGDDKTLTLSNDGSVTYGSGTLTVSASKIEFNGYSYVSREEFLEREIREKLISKLEKHYPDIRVTLKLIGDDE